MTKPITASVKADNAGIGGTQDWSSTWWDHVFNKASAGIKIENDEQGQVVIKKQLEEEEKKKLLYGSFVKKSVEKKDYSIKVSDKELFEACEGRTARKGARASQPGKLKRTLDHPKFQHYQAKLLKVESKIKKYTRKQKTDKLNQAKNKRQKIQKKLQKYVA